MSQENKGGGQAAFIGMEVMLRHPGSIEAEALGGHDLLLGVVIASAGGNVVEHACEKAKALAWGGLCHGQSCS
ncbi:hypothetical protein D9M70_435460 [compost metagenome]